MEWVEEYSKPFPSYYKFVAKASFKQTLNIYQFYLTSSNRATFKYFLKKNLREKVKRTRKNISNIQQRINFLDEANMTKFVVNYLNMYQPGKYFYKKKFGLQARRKKDELKFLVKDDLEVQYSHAHQADFFLK